MSATTISKTIGDIAAESPAAAAIFEKLGLDYCCGGARTLDQACRAAGVSAAEVEESIERAAAGSAAPERNWTTEPLADLIAHIRDTHHVYTRAAIERLNPLFAKVRGVHGKNHTELLQMQTVFDSLAEELGMHLMKEEMMLFPFIVRLEEAAVEKSSPPPSPFGSVRNPVSMMEHEHDSAGDALRHLRSLSAGYTMPADGCASYRSLYQALEGLEADLHQHIHLENNILFPRAIQLEQAR
jgi:regulator of cell morphogenesis and NO signaling